MGISVKWQTSVSPELDEKVQQLADSMGLGKQEFIRFVVAQYVHNQITAMGYVQSSIESMLKETEERKCKE